MSESQVRDQREAQGTGGQSDSSAANGVQRRRGGYFPSLRGTVLEVIKLAGDPNRSDEQLFRVISGDPSLSIQILNFANSAAFRLETEVTSISRAVSVIGSQALRNMAICFAACESTPLDAIGAFDFASFLEDSLRRGAAAELLARHLNLPDPDEAFTAGLIQDFGVVALAMHEPHLADQWNMLRVEAHGHRREMERALFGLSHDEIAGKLATRWQLPEALGSVMRDHHDPERTQGTPWAKLAAIANIAEVLADVFVVADKQKALTEAHGRLEREWGMAPALIDQLLAAIPARVKIFADAMNIRISPQSTLSEVIEEIRAHHALLVQMNLAYQKEAWRLEELIREKEETERELRLAKARLERLATTDPLTLLPNRRHFETHLERELMRSQQQGTPLSLAVADVDFFKGLNDTYGHPFGDMVLRMVASTLRSQVRQTDLVARIGGEEFAILLPGASRRNAMEVTERLRKAVEMLELQCGDARVKVTISFGGATILRLDDDVPLPKAGYVLAGEADQALYAAKRSGRNRVAWKPKPVEVEPSVMQDAGRPARGQSDEAFA